ncbi:MAG TPA: DUF4382 domain-containing protein [Gammaproteobacteria bacterium]|nr:DUF4382 domain-containing protein [Gammaproteobacteria bacterium]
MSRLILRCILVCCVLLLASCGGSGNTGLTVYLTDAPIDNAISVNIGLVGVKVQGTGGVYYFPTPQIETPDFYQLQGGLEGYLMTAAQLPAGEYQSISLDFSADVNSNVSSIALTDGTVHQLYIPTGEPTTVTAPINFTMPSNGEANITIDLDLRKSIIKDPNNPTKYILRPVLRAVNNNSYGTISGTVDTTLLTSTCVPAVYIYSGDVTPTDVEINATSGIVQPITSALVGLNVTSGQYGFTAGFLPPGQYTAAFTCEANLDNPDTADTIHFSSVKQTTVTNHATAIVTMN